MIFTTENGSVYEVSGDQTKARRLYGYDDPENPFKINGEWVDISGIIGLDVGSRVVFCTDKLVRTSKVVNIYG
jgi:hypothetical protein